MKKKKNEVGYYPELCIKLRNYFEEHLSESSKVEFSYNKPLPSMVREIEEKLGASTELSSDYIPSLKLDILCGILSSSNKIALSLFEVKYDNKLTLANFSQLAGYLQVAKKIRAGTLLLINKDISSHTLSNDFSDILIHNCLPLEWQLLVKKLDGDPYDFKIGIASYVPNNGIDWVSCKNANGISSFAEHVEFLLETS